jgi:regulator of protease activity HflC (stomatin/prohibitin superfamily)
MFNIGYFKGQPTDYIIKYVNGRVRRSGAGLTFFYLRHNTQIAAVPISSTDSNFVFNELTNNFQAVTIQGQCTYRISDPLQAASLLNFTLNLRTGAHESDDPAQLKQRITNVIQMETRSEIQQRTLEETLGQSEAIAARVLHRIQESSLLANLGVELLNVYFLTARPTPEVGKALEATYRETLLRRADEAIYARRAAAVEEERKIKENELNTDITLEQQRQQLIDLAGRNAQQEAELRGQATELEAQYNARAAELQLGVYRTFQPSAILALAMKELGENAGRVGNLTITSEMLAALLNLNGETTLPPNGAHPSS